MMNTVRNLLLAPLLMGATLLFSSCGAPQLSQLSAVTPLPPTVDATQAPAPATPQPPASARADRTQAPTPTPLNLDLPAGSALAVAHATDAALRPTPRNPVTFDERPVRLSFDEFYDGYNVRTGLILSDKLVSLDGQEVIIEGYMAPPLKAELDWFVLTRIQLAYCPFCSTAADWPDDIALVYLGEGTIRPTEKPMRLYGRLEVGPSVDPETGMVSLVRIYAEKLETL
jgi:hypothetical protein